MAQALTDTSAIYALIDRDDTNHRKAAAILRASVRQGITPLITNFIVAESHALLLFRLGPGIARDWLTKQIWPVEPVTPADEKKAKEIIQHYTTDPRPLTAPTKWGLSAFAFDVFFATRGKSMPSTAMKLEQRVTVLERELRKVRSELKSVRTGSQQPWWKQLAGSFKNDPIFDEIIEAGHAHRRSLARRAR